MTNTHSSFQSLRIMLDVRLPSSAMVVVSSACEGDGEDELAYGLAQAFAETGRRTALIKLNGYHDGMQGTADVESNFNGSRFHAPASPNELNSLVTDVRYAHDVVIVASPPLGEQSASLDLCRLANGVLLAVRLGRKVTPRDQEAVEQLKRLDARLLGTVAMRSVASTNGEREAANAPAWSLEAAGDLSAKIARSVLMWAIIAGTLTVLLGPVR